MGRTYARPIAGTGRRPEKNVSARPKRDAPRRCLFLETAGFAMDQQPKLHEIGFWFGYIRLFVTLPIETNAARQGKD
jgi:hypothetical protein